MLDHPMYQSHILDHLGLVAGMFDELGIGDVLDQATHHNPDLRDLPPNCAPRRSRTTA